MGILVVLLACVGDPQGTKRIEVGPGVTLEIAGTQRRVLIASEVVLNKGVLEGLLTRAKKKEHEYILAADVDARHIHAALTLAGAREGSPVQFTPKYQPATGSGISVQMRYKKAGKTITVSPGAWIHHDKTGMPLTESWVFGGSRFVENPEGNNKPPVYLANHGDLICVCNMESALLDLAVRSPKAFNDRLYRAVPEEIPAIGTKVELILELLPKK